MRIDSPKLTRTANCTTKTSSTAFVTFNTRVTKICAQKLLLSDDGMDIKVIYL